VAKAERVLDVAGVPAVFTAKARAFFKALRDERLGEGRQQLTIATWVLRLGYGALGAAVVGVIASFAGIAGAEIPAMVGVPVGLILLLGGHLTRSSAQGILAQPDVAPDLQALLRALAADWAAKQPLDGVVDLREAKDAVASERSATSPYSRATKLYYRHRWFRAAGRLVDGTHLAIEGTALVKTKAGHPIRRELQLRGRLRPGALLGRPTWKGGRDFGRLHTVVDGDELLFWAPVEAMDEVLPDLERIVRKLAGLPDEPGGGAVGKA
jgi:hypothetical protein